MFLVGLILLLTLPGLGGRALAADANAAPVWVVSPFEPGPELPPAGRSLFETLFVDENGQLALPQPFSALLDRLDALGACPDLPDGRCVQAVLIPIGRSLQRLAARPDFFARPRIVAALAGEPDPARKLGDRLYLGFVEGTGLIEVISYNAAAGRFEFQLVRDYLPGKTPQLAYARRAICIACHQNQAPIFSRPLWQESSANPAISALLGPARPAFHGVRPDRGVDVPRAIDNASDRANQLALWQRLWREVCAAHAAHPRPPSAPSERDAGARDAAVQTCRSALLAASLWHRMERGRGYPAQLRAALRPTFAATAAQRWPNGLALPNADIPNRDPLRDLPLHGQTPGTDAQTPGTPLAHIPAVFEPLQLREASAVWHHLDDAAIDATVAGLGAQVPQTDIERLRAAPLLRDTAHTGIDPLADAIGRLADTDPAFARALTDDAAFQAERLMPALLARLAGEATPSAQAPAPASVATAPAPVSGAGGLLAHYCGNCHDHPEDKPPNFLAGTEAIVATQLDACAPRIRHRIGQWRVPTAQRDKTPMPPPQALHALGLDPRTWPESAEYAALHAYAQGLGPTARTHDLSGGNYEALPACRH